MLDYVKLTSADLASAVSPETAVVAFTLDGETLKSGCFDSTLDVDAVVMCGTVKLGYIRANAGKILDFFTDDNQLLAGVVVSVYCVSTPGSGDIVLDCLL